MPPPTTVQELCAALAQIAQQLANALTAPKPVGLPPLPTAIYAALTSQPQTAKTLAKKCRRKNNTNFRAALRLLVDQGYARRTSQGYSLP